MIIRLLMIPITLYLYYQIMVIIALFGGHYKSKWDFALDIIIPFRKVILWAWYEFKKLE